MSGELEAALRELLSAHVEVPADPAAPLDLPSLSLVVVAEELEARFGFVVAAREMAPANFGSLAALAAYCGRKQGA
jgi:anti-sigma factor RsiW